MSAEHVARILGESRWVGAQIAKAHEKQRGQPLTRDKLESMLPSDEQRR